MSDKTSRTAPLDALHDTAALVSPGTEQSVADVWNSHLGLLWSQYDAIGKIIAAAEIRESAEAVEVVHLPALEQLQFEYFRLAPNGSMTAIFASESLPAHCPVRGVNETMLQRAIEARALVVEDWATTGGGLFNPSHSDAAVCATCALSPCGFSLAMPVLWEAELLGVCRVVRSGASREYLTAEKYFLARLAESIAASEKYHQLRLSRDAERREVVRQRAELERVEFRMRLAAMVSCDALVALDPATGVSIVEKAGNGLRYPMPTELQLQDLRQWWLDLVHPDDLDIIHMSRQAIMDQPGVSANAEYRIKATDGGWLHVRQASVYAAGSADRPAMIVAAMKDVTGDVEAQERITEERARLETLVMDRTHELSEANADLARAARLKDEFLASMSHELRTPLNAILGMTEATREQIWGPITPEQDDKLRIVEESGRHLLSLINDILDLAKIGAGKLAPEMGPVDVIGTAASTLRLVTQLAMEKQIHLASRLPEEGPIIDTDGRIVMQILLNLLNNAVKFTQAGGRVLLEVDVNANVVTFRVTDTGIGIAADELGRIFKPFVQVNRGLARAYGGTGLGLALVARLADAIHGTVSVESEPGVGSVFTLTLPTHVGGLEAAAAAVPTGAVKAHLSSPRRTILLAEDNDANARTYVGYLVAKGYDVLVAPDGEEAIRMAQESHPAIILMDIQMPNMDGIETITRLRADPAFAATPIIALTALAMPGDRERCLLAGANDYVTKPTSLRDLTARIGRFLDMKDAGDMT